MSRIALLAGSLVLLLAAPASAITITEFPVEAGSAAGAHVPYFITAGPDGGLWFTDRGSSRGIGRISTTGERLPPLTVGAPPLDIVAGSNGNVYWTESADAARRLPNGTVSLVGAGGVVKSIEEDSGGTVWFGWNDYNPTPAQTKVSTPQNPSAWSGGIYSHPVNTFVGANFTDITRAADQGGLWIASFEEGSVRKFNNPGGYVLKVDLPAGGRPQRVALGPDGNAWATDSTGNAIHRITPGGVRTAFALAAGAEPTDIVAGPDGALWFTERGANKIGRMTIDGTLAGEFPVPTGGSQPRGIVVGADGALWFTEEGAGKIGRLQLDPAGGSDGSGGSGSGGGPGVVVDQLAPAFTRGLAAVPARFRVGLRSTALTAGARRPAPRGTSLRFTLSEPAAVTIAIARALPGRRVGARCVRPTRANRSRRRCTRYVTKATLRRQGLSGANRVAFSGRIRGRAMSLGRYRASATAKDAAGNKSKASRAFFRIVRR